MLKKVEINKNNLVKEVLVEGKLNDRNITRYSHKLYNEMFGSDAPIFFKVKRNGRLKTTAGRYSPKDVRIDLNPRYIEGVKELDDNSEEWKDLLDVFIEILKHELVHLYQHVEGLPLRHDHNFKSILMAVGGSGETYLPKEAASKVGIKRKRRPYTFFFHCDKCKKEFKRKRKVSLDKYRCKCGGSLVFDRDTTKKGS